MEQNGAFLSVLEGGFEHMSDERDKAILKLSQEAANEISEKGLSEYPLLKKRCRALLSEDIVMN